MLLGNSEKYLQNFYAWLAKNMIQMTIIGYKSFYTGAEGFTTMIYLF